MTSFFGQGSPFEGRHSRQAPRQRGQDLEIELPVFLKKRKEEHKRTISYHLPVYNVLWHDRERNSKTLNVKIPAGVVDGQRIRLKAKVLLGRMAEKMVIYG